MRHCMDVAGATYSTIRGAKGAMDHVPILLAQSGRSEVPEDAG